MNSVIKIVFIAWVSLSMLAQLKLNLFASDIPIYEPVCLSSIGTLSVGGTSLSNPVQTNSNFSINNPATLTQTSSTYLAYSVDYFDDGLQNSDNNDSYDDRLDKVDTPYVKAYRYSYKNRLYNYQNANFGFVFKVEKFISKRDATNDSYLIAKFKTKNFSFAINNCNYYSSYIYDINRNLGYREGYIYDTTAKQIYQNWNSVILTVAYKDFIENLDIGVNIIILKSKYYSFDNVNMAHEDKYNSYYVYPENNDATLNNNNIDGFGVTLGATYKDINNPGLIYGSSIQLINLKTENNNKFNIKSNFISPLPLMTIGLGASWATKGDIIEWINSIELVNITAKGQQVHNWFEDHLGTEMKFFVRKKHLFPLVTLRAGYNRRRLAYGAEFNLFENRAIYFGATGGSLNIGYGGKDNIVSINNSYYGGIGYIF